MEEIIWEEIKEGLKDILSQDHLIQILPELTQWKLVQLSSCLKTKWLLKKSESKKAEWWILFSKMHNISSLKDWASLLQQKTLSGEENSLIFQAAMNGQIIYFLEIGGFFVLHLEDFAWAEVATLLDKVSWNSPLEKEEVSVESRSCSGLKCWRALNLFLDWFIVETNEKEGTSSLSSLANPIEKSVGELRFGMEGLLWRCWIMGSGNWLVEVVVVGGLVEELGVDWWLSVVIGKVWRDFKITWEGMRLMVGGGWLIAKFWEVVSGLEVEEALMGDLVTLGEVSWVEGGGL